jgi:serine/threonine-protein kinase RsbW
MAPTDSTIRLAFPSTFEMIDLVLVVSDHVCRLAGLEEEALHWVGVAVRESVINAIKHGNRHDPEKLVLVEFSALPPGVPAQLVVRVADQGDGFDPDLLEDPLASANLLKPSGRGIFFMRSFMDDVTIRRRPEGGTEVRMVKSLPAQG